MRKLIPLLSLALIAAGCGGGGGGSSQLSTSSNGVTLTTYVTSSIVKGAQVCVKGTDICAQTDSTGKAQLTVDSLPVTLEVVAGGVSLGEVKVGTDSAVLSPTTVAEGNATIAAAIAAAIHAMAGDTTGTAQTIDLSNVTVENPPADPIEELVKQGKTVSLKVKKDDQEHSIEIKPVESDNGTTVEVYCDGEKVEVADELKELYWKMGTFLTAVDGQSVSLATNKSNEVVQCTLNVNPDNPYQFKLTQCSNSTYNSLNWNTVKLSEDGVQIEVAGTSDTYWVEDVNLKEFSVSYTDRNGLYGKLWLTGSATITPPNVNDEELETALAQGEFDTVYSALHSLSNLNDTEKLLLALAVIGKSAKDGFLTPMGYSIVTPSYSPFFRVEKTGPEFELSPKEYKDHLKDLLEKLNTAIGYVESIQNPATITLPDSIISFYSLTPGTHLDKETLTTIKAALYLARANVEYSLAYNWENVDFNSYSVLKEMEKLQIENTALIDSAKNDLKEALKLAAQAGQDFGSAIHSGNYSSQDLTFNILIPDSANQTVNVRNDNCTVSYDNIDTLVESLGGLPDAVDKQVDVLYSGNLCSDNATFKQATIYLGTPFTQPITGDQITQDVDNGNMLEVKVCTDYYYYYDNGTEVEQCLRFERDIWFNKDSNLYKFLTSMDPNAQFAIVNYNGTEFYSLDGIYFDTDYGTYYIVFPTQNQ
ncbi:hypothetical protein [Thermovibrio ammonificans]|uniref:Lipoprotein n=1 Tax=Thermovibrio ammonificans (strain DSM 15698 / JCM 12110 / HB-1) TaxID=648996 RepID=E8T450_THEA1|nr:hypothetical protein [Thermovibrio ammonificans]ADU97379.1 hypothetical protein Theam_1416 [Thermovibrio ammonificans HB-1]